MSRYLILCTGIFFLVGCSSQPTKPQKISSSIQFTDASQITLSHAKAYLLIGDIQQAQKTFDGINNPQTVPNAMILQAELKAATGNIVGAQQDFLFALNNNQLSRNKFSSNLLDYFCHNKKWPAIEAYGAKINKNTTYTNSMNTQLTTIGLCFYSNQHWNKTAFWLAKLNFDKPVNPVVYLALARANVGLKNLESVQDYMDSFEENKIQVSADSLWASIEVYQALNKPNKTKQLVSNLRLLFPSWNRPTEYTPVIAVEQSKPKPVLTDPTTRKIEKVVSISNIHIIQRGETLYKLSKDYNISIVDLLKWNPNLVIDDIPLGTPVHLSAAE